MKYCPECATDFSDSEVFCEFDGASLVSVDSDAGLKLGTNLKMIAVAAGGVVIGVMLFLIYYAMTREPAKQSSNRPSLNSSVVMQQQAPLLPSIPTLVASPSPSVEPLPSPSPSPSPSATPAASPQTERRVELSASAISTASDEESKTAGVLIRLTDGPSIEADDAWRTAEGIWYRRGGVVALLDPKQVKAIKKVPATPQPSPSESPSPSPAQTSPRIITATRVQR